jgi:hypothetical protein
MGCFRCRVRRLTCRSVTQAIFGLVGVLIGGLLTGGVDYVMSRREERETMRSLARALHAELLEMRSQCSFCADLGNWHLIDQTFVLPSVWQDHELVLGRLLTWEQWAGLQAVRVSQAGVRQLAQLSNEAPQLRQTQLPTVTAAAIEAIDHVLPDFERLAGATRRSSR